MQILQDDLQGPEIRALLAEHMTEMLSHAPPESVHTLGIERLRQPDITFWTVWSEGELLGCGALKELSLEHGELKSMRTAIAHRRKGVAQAMLQHIFAEARQRGYTRLSLETGSMAAFIPAHKMYERFGFTYCPRFGDYPEDPNSVFMTCVL